MALFGSITELTSQERGLHALVGSHGGFATGAHSACIGIASLICHDAGIGMDAAGIAALETLQQYGIPAAAVSHLSARIGDAADMAARGRISHANGAARALGVETDMAASIAQARMQAASGSSPQEIVAAPFTRSVELCAGQEVTLCDSASMIAPEDAGRIVITGSHGGLPGGQASRAAKAHVALAVFNDAGLGIDDAGIARLPALDAMSIPAAAVDCRTAHIGVARSTLKTGLLSHVNQSAARLGLSPGMTVRDSIAATATFLETITP